MITFRKNDTTVRQLRLSDSTFIAHILAFQLKRVSPKDLISLKSTTPSHYTSAVSYPIYTGSLDNSHIKGLQEHELPGYQYNVCPVRPLTKNSFKRWSQDKLRPNYHLGTYLEHLTIQSRPNGLAGIYD